MQPHRRRLDQVLDPEYMTGLEDLDLDQLRERRNLAVDVENELSYYRRLIYGRMDLLRYEQRRRSGEETRSVMDSLVDILTDPRHPDGGSERRGQAHIVTDLPPLPDVGKRDIDAVIGDDVLLRLDEASDDDLDRSIASLEAMAVEVSGQRQTAQRVIDGLTDLIAERFEAEAGATGDA